MSGGRFMKLSYVHIHCRLTLNLCYQFCQIHWAILDTRENIPFARGMLAFWEGPEMSFRAAAYYSNIFHMQLGTRLLSLIQELQPTCSFQQKSMIWNETTTLTNHPHLLWWVCWISTVVSYIVEVPWKVWGFDGARDKLTHLSHWHNMVHVFEVQ